MNIVIINMLWGLMAIGVYISYKILDIADLTAKKTGGKDNA